MIVLGPPLRVTPETPETPEPRASSAASPRICSRDSRRTSGWNSLELAVITGASSIGLRLSGGPSTLPSAMCAGWQPVCRCRLLGRLLGLGVTTSCAAGQVAVVLPRRGEEAYRWHTGPHARLPATRSGAGGRPAAEPPR